MGKITVFEKSVNIADLDIPEPHIADFLAPLPAEDLIPTMLDAIRIGFLCLERSDTSKDIEFVRRELNGFLNTVAAAVQAIPVKTEQALVGRMGADGEVMQPIKAMIGQVSAISAARVEEVKRLLVNDLDPAKATSTLGSALKQIHSLLDPNQSNSVQGALEVAVRNVAGHDGMLAAAVKATVEESLKPLREEMDRLAKEIRGDHAADALKQQTTLKGSGYEEQVCSVLQNWGKNVGAEVHHVGGDNEPGDILIIFRGDGLVPEQFTIVVEVRDRPSDPMGRQKITNEMARKMAERGAQAGIYLSRSEEGLSKHEIGDWAEGVCANGPWIACTDPYKVMAVRFLVNELRLAIRRMAGPEVDAASIEGQVKFIRTSLGRIKTIKSKLTEMAQCSDSIQDQVDLLREEIKTALSSIEDALRANDVEDQAA